MGRPSALADIREACVFVLPWLPGDGGRKGVLRQARDADLDGMVMRVERDIARVNEALYGQLASKVALGRVERFQFKIWPSPSPCCQFLRS